MAKVNTFRAVRWAYSALARPREEGTGIARAEAEVGVAAVPGLDARGRCWTRNDTGERSRGTGLVLLGGCEEKEVVVYGWP